MGRLGLMVRDPLLHRPDISGGIVGLPGSEGWIVVWPQGG